MRSAPKKFIGLLQFLRGASAVVSFGDRGAVRGNMVYNGACLVAEAGAFEISVDGGSSFPVAVGASSLECSAKAGYGVKLPATPGNANSQTLDCYVEGSWTPQLLADGSNPTVSYAAYTYGVYTRIGRMVHFEITLSTTAFSGGSGYLRINLPPALASISNTVCACMADAVTLPAGRTQLSGNPYTDGYLYLVATGSGVDDVPLTVAAWPTTSGWVKLNGSYRAS